MEIRFALIAEGVTDQVLIPIIKWLIRKYIPNVTLETTPPFYYKASLEERFRRVSAENNLDILFVHLDEEPKTVQQRRDEIQEASSAYRQGKETSIVCIIPIRETEAWFLFNEEALRRAAGKPRGRSNLSLPNLSRIEEIDDPKAVLEEALRVASETTGSKLKDFKRQEPNQFYRLAEIIEDFSPLCQLSAFQAFEADVQAILARWTVENGGA
jgi:hypothetical protein